MGVLSVRETFLERGGDDTTNGEATDTRTFFIETSSKLDTKEKIKNDPRVVQKGQPHPDNPYLTAQRFNFRQVENSSTHWFLTVEYSTVPAADGPANQNQQVDPNVPANPLMRPATVRWQGHAASKAISKAWPLSLNNSNVANTQNSYQVQSSNTTADLRMASTGSNLSVISNSAGVPFSRPAEASSGTLHAVISKNMNPVPFWVLKYGVDPANVNSADMTLGGLQFYKGQLRYQFHDISELQVENQIYFYKVQFELHYREEGWELALLDQGVDERVYVQQVAGQSGGYELRRIRDADGAPISEAVLLDGQGKRLKRGLTNQDQHFLRAYRYYPHADFGVITALF